MQADFTAFNDLQPSWSLHISKIHTVHVCFLQMAPWTGTVTAMKIQIEFSWNPILHFCNVKVEENKRIAKGVVCVFLHMLHGCYKKIKFTVSKRKKKNQKECT